jgi:hypothetical protein
MRDRAGRRAENEIVFRDANERQAEAIRRIAPDGLLPFICECEDETCFEVLQLTIAEFEAVRERPDRFFLVHGHAHPDETVVDRHDRFDIVEKSGLAGSQARAG